VASSEVGFAKLIHIFHLNCEVVGQGKHFLERTLQTRTAIDAIRFVSPRVYQVRREVIRRYYRELGREGIHRRFVTTQSPRSSLQILPLEPMA
jgi:hypothetical protein